VFSNFSSDICIPGSVISPLPIMIAR